MSSLQTYRDLSEQHPLPLFFRTWWLEMTGADWDAAIVQEDGVVKAIWPYTREKKAGINIIRNPLLTPYLGPLFFLSPDLKPNKRFTKEDKLYKKLWAQMPDWDFFDVQCLPGYNNFLPFHHQGFDHTQKITYHISLEQDEGVIFSSLKSSERNHIRQAERELEIIDAAGYIDLFYELHKDTLTRKGEKYPYTSDYFKNLIDTTVKNNAGLNLAVRNSKGEICAAIHAVHDHRTMYLLLSATNKLAMHTGAIALLIWAAIRSAKQMGLEIFDFEGSMDPGIEMFFRSFGGERLTYLSCTSNRSKVWKLKRALLG